jgi:PKD repeat protein
VFDSHEWNLTVVKGMETPEIRWQYPSNDTVTLIDGETRWFSIGTDGEPIQWHVDGAAQLGAIGQSFEFRPPMNATVSTVMVTVGDSDNVVSHVWTVNIRHPPVAIINASDLVIKPGDRVQFSGSGSRDPDSGSGISQMSWSLGDGTPIKTGIEVDHIYKKTGVYNVVLKVTDSDGLEATAEVTIIVKAKPEEAPGLDTGSFLIALGLALVFTFGRRKKDDD